ncbi:uncharacterized protein KD926_008998 [Aspergillus affinis]|uniref:uncharacterized protein n=1 Tax=Aspergillus affinis TaxID=1070780 RepID=UPI0022FEACE7|nr:uncharacterized protein KD926_008998 [Aspergillus affinis]KAI9039897.1 hypothetical protein KD926_008998 [Aspergillus affinis]
MGRPPSHFLRRRLQVQHPLWDRVLRVDMLFSAWLEMDFVSNAEMRIRDHALWHIREYPGATLHTQEDILHLSVKQYIPWDNPDPQPGYVTVIGAHANAFAKELYGPLREDIICHAKTYGFRIRAIWISDVAHQGQSAVFNEDWLGNNPSWFDHSRDLLNLVNNKRTDMPPPIVGIGHSMGGSQLFVPLEGFLAIQREAAAETFSRSPIYKAWDKRVLQNWLKYGLRDVPTPYPLDERASYDQKLTALTIAGNNIANRTISHPDVDPALITSFPFYLPGPSQLFEQLPHVRPSVLYVFAEKSPMCLPALCEDKLYHTGTGMDGSGGVAAGRVRSTYLEGLGHLVAQEAPNQCAEMAARWIGPEIKRWQDKNSLITTGRKQKISTEKRALI